MKRIYLIMLMIAAMMVSCNPNDDDDNSNSGGGNGGGNDQYNGYEYVDLGLPSGLKWATCNVGATSPEDYGDYFAWGETSPKAEYTIENSITYGEQMSDISGNAQYDAATANWRGSWRMPTKDEMQELLDYCEFEWTQNNGVDLYKITGPNTNSIFLPAVGYRFGTSSFGSCIIGCYWTSTSIGYDSDAYHLYLDRNYESNYVVDADIKLYNNRSYGHAIRPVSD